MRNPSYGRLTMQAVTCVFFSFSVILLDLSMPILDGACDLIFWWGYRLK